MAERETIVATAIRIETPEELATQMCRGKPVYPAHIIVTAPPPARHANLMHPVAIISGKTTAADNQGFITSTGRYVGREDALRIAIRAEQPLIDHLSRHPAMLFSEDLW